MLNHITQALKKLGNLTLTGFGTFKVSKSKARGGRNPKTEESIQIAAKILPKFAPGKTLNAAINLQHQIAYYRAAQRLLF